MTKQELRSQMQARRDKVDMETRSRCGRSIAAQFLESDDFRFSRRFCCFLSTTREVSTGRIVRAIFDAGHALCVPAWDRDARAYGLYEMRPDTPLLTGHKGIREPATRLPVMPRDIDCFIVPGLAFDLRGGRVGYGKGYYDRLLAGAGAAARIVAVCYDWQVVEEPIGLEPHDIRMHLIITDKRSIRCA